MVSLIPPRACRTRAVVLSLVFLTISLPAVLSADAPAPAESLKVILRCDDIGMCHTVNQAFETVIVSGIPVSASVMVPCPWFDEAVSILKAAPNVSVGIHLTLNSEWKNYRWGPVSGSEAVPSLVDSNGYFFPSRALLFANNPTLEDVEHELRAQIERALRSGLHVDYLDYHMGAAVSTPELRVLVERLADEYGLAVSRYFGERDVEGLYAAPIERKKDTLMTLFKTLEGPEIRLQVFHIGFDSPEMKALIDLNESGLPEMSRHREAELKALLSPEFRSMLENRGIRLVTYRDLRLSPGLEAMKRPPEL